MGSVTRKRTLLKWGVVASVILLPLVAAALWWAAPGVDFGAWRSGPAPAPWAAWRIQVDRWAEAGVHRPIEHGWVPLAEISPDLQLAVLVGEDIDFLGHGAVDLREVWDVLEGWRSGERLRGASTIAQQLARTLFLNQERTLWRKLKELRLAWWLEHRLGKRRVFELYLNVVEFAPGVFGAEAGSMHYFGVSCRSLDPEQAAGLAAAIPAPGRDNPDTGSKRWLFRRSIIASRMTRADWLRKELAAFGRTGGR
jgi:monofunctional biosynthetic peptidoglycan transglycosylase